MVQTASLALPLCWVALGVFFIAGRRPPRAREVRRGRRWALGMALQGLGIALVWTLRRPFDTPLAAGDWGAALALGAVLLAACSVWLMVASRRKLGAQWAYQPRLLEGHELVTSGPYAYLRHPIYTGLFGLTLATALVFSRWLALPAFTAVYGLGTLLRVRSEEELLRSAFGAAYDAYARRVPAVIPGIW